MSYAVMPKPRHSAPARGPKSIRPVLTVVEASGPKRSPFVTWLFVPVFLFIFILAPLGINTAMAQISFNMHTDQVKLEKLTQENQDLLVKVQSVSSPESLRRFATKHDMVPALDPGYVTLKTKKVEGGKAAQ